MKIKDVINNIGKVYSIKSTEEHWFNSETGFIATGNLSSVITFDFEEEYVYTKGDLDEIKELEVALISLEDIHRLVKSIFDPTFEVD